MTPFPGDGEMARLMREFDWSSTPLGDSRAWPQGLKAAVRILLTSRFAMWMGWGKDLTFFYNDAYGQMTLGAKHPWALGRPSSEVWAEIWPQIGPRIDRVLTTGEATWDERLLLFLERSGYREETYHTFSYSPLAGDDGRIEGHLCVVTEETERILDERRLSLLKEVAGRLSAVKEVPDVFAGVREAIATDPRPIPWSVSYLFSGSDASVMLRTGLAADITVPSTLSVDELGDWLGVAALDTQLQVVPVPLSLCVSTPTWDQPSTEMIVAPISHQGTDRSAGIFIVGANPFRRADDRYRSFIRLFAGHIASGISAARAYEEERRRTAALAEIDRAKTVFFSNVSHELRTPLTLMLGPTEEAVRGDGVLSGEDLHTVHRSEVRLLKLVNTLLDFSRIEAGRMTAALQPVRLDLVTADLASMFRSSIERGGLTLTVNCEPLPAAVMVDPQMWEKIVLNLLSNAFKFTLEGRITVSLRAEAGAAVLIVSDTGVGIAPTHLPRIFERFHRIEGAPARTHEGSGIGLALVRDLVELQGGTITVSSGLGQGTTFTVTLPLSPNASLPSDPASERSSGMLGSAFVSEASSWLSPDNPRSEPADADPALPQTGHVLVADDNADMRAYTARLLSAHWSVETVSDGRQALEAIGRRAPDVVVTDLMMPNLDGWGLLAAMRADLQMSRIPVIALSARAGEEARVTGLEAGADDYLVKPFSARELVARVSIQMAQAQARKAVIAERDRLQRLLDDVPAVINFLAGPELVFEYVHPLAKKALGRDVIGRSVWEAIPEYAHQPEVRALLTRAYESGQTHSGREQRVLIDRHGTGDLEESFWDYTHVPIRDSSGAIAGVMTFDIDVTERVRAHQRLQQYASELEQVQTRLERDARAKDEFLAMLGHELRNPLAPIKSAIEMLRLRAIPEIASEQAVLARQSDHLVRLVDDLLDVSRIASGKIILSRAQVDASTVVANAVEQVRPMIEARSQRLDVQLSNGALPVFGDAARLSQALSNLLTNASKFSDRGGLITVQAKTDHRHVVISVIDQGIGIDPGSLAHIFDTFAQEPQALDRSRGGLGLGLTIAKKVADLHDGVIEAFSEGHGCGSRFNLRIPMIESVEPAAVPAAPVGPGRAQAWSALVVDDNVDAAEMLAFALRIHGHRAAVAHDGPSALAAVSADAVDVAILDIGLPGMDGYELCARLREHTVNRPMTIVALTGYGAPANVQRAADAGFDRHFVKPIDIDAMVAAIDDLRAPNTTSTSGERGASTEASAP